MAMRYIEGGLRGTGDPGKQESLGKDIPLPSVVTSVEKPSVKTSELQTFSQDQLILPETALPQEVSDALQRAEKAGIGVFEAYRLSGITLTRDSQVKGWDKKPDDWYWDQIKNGKLSPDAAKLPDAWVLIDKTQKKDYNKYGKQMYKNDPFGPILQKLRNIKKIQSIKGTPDTSRFGISHYELTLVVLPEIAKLLGVDKSAVKLPKEIEFNVIGNFKHPEWGKINTWEWFDDKFGVDRRLRGGFSGYGGLASVNYDWSDRHRDLIGFRPFVVFPSKA